MCVCVRVGVCVEDMFVSLGPAALARKMSSSLYAFSFGVDQSGCDGQAGIRKDERPSFQRVVHALQRRKKRKNRNTGQRAEPEGEEPDEHPSE